MLSDASTEIGVKVLADNKKLFLLSSSDRRKGLSQETDREGNITAYFSHSSNEN